MQTEHQTVIQTGQAGGTLKLTEGPACRGPIAKGPVCADRRSACTGRVCATVGVCGCGSGSDSVTGVYVSVREPVCVGGRLTVAASLRLLRTLGCP